MLLGNPAFRVSQHPIVHPEVSMAHHTDDREQARAQQQPVRAHLGATEQGRASSSAPVALPFLDDGRSPVADLLCFSHLRWDLVFQRPQHLLTRAARTRRVFYVEEPVFGAASLSYEVRPRQGGVHRVLLHLPDGLDEAACVGAQRELVDALVAEHGIANPLLWYYTPMALSFSRHLRGAATVYDCMDELSAFAGAHPGLRAREAELLERADLVFTGGQSLYESKRTLHPRVHAFPSSVDAAHFRRARSPQHDPPEQAPIPRPRLGFFGVIDERMDLDLVRDLAARRPDWHFVFLGPVVKISSSALPAGPNLHYLGPKAYDDLPSYLAGWDVALLPFAMNEATRFISPTKTPEYLAAGCPVVSTPIRDVVRPYGQQGLARIAGTPQAFAAAIEESLEEDRGARLARVDAFLSQMSWDLTWARMSQLVDAFVGVTRAAADPGVAARSGAASVPSPV
jgi:UDP-galactopyranose mutase